MDCLLGGLLMWRSIGKMTSIVQNKIMEVSLTAADFLDGDAIAALTKEDKEKQTPQYVEAFTTLSTFRTNSVDNNAGLAYIYCVVKLDDGRMVFSIDPSEDPGVFLEEETLTTKALIKAFEGTAGFDTQSYVDRWGDLYSAYAPVKGVDGTVKAVVGVDVWASWYKKEIASSAIMIGIVTGATIVLGVLAAIFITRKMRKRLDELTLEMDELQSDIHLLIKDIQNPNYMPEIIEDNESGGGGLVQLRKQIDSTRYAVKHYIDYAHKQAYVDVLTGLGNRNAYFELVEDINQKIKDKVYVNFAVILFDINGLKIINDEYGHEAGDNAIIVAGECLKELFGEEISYRIGGDELVVIYQNVYKDTIENKLSQLDNIIQKYSEPHQLNFKLTLSYGYSFFNEEKDKRYEDVFNKADEKMYTEKARFYDSIKTKARKRHKHE